MDNKSLNAACFLTVTHIDSSPGEPLKDGSLHLPPSQQTQKKDTDQESLLSQTQDNNLV